MTVHTLERLQEKYDFLLRKHERLLNERDDKIKEYAGIIDKLATLNEMSKGVLERIPHTYHRTDFGGEHGDDCLRCMADQVMKDMEQLSQKST